MKKIYNVIDFILFVFTFLYMVFSIFITALIPILIPINLLICIILDRFNLIRFFVNENKLSKFSLKNFFLDFYKTNSPVFITMLLLNIVLFFAYYFAF